MEAMPKKLMHLILCCLCLGLCTAWAEPVANKTLILGVHPYLSEKEIQERFTPLATYLGHVLGVPIEVHIGKNYQEHLEAISHNQIDIAFLGPSTYVDLTQQHHDKPLLARFEVNHQPNLYGVIAVRSDSPLHKLRELKGKRIAFVDEYSTMGYLVPNVLLKNAGVPLNTLTASSFLKAHNNVALAVLAGDYDAGAMKQEVFDEYASQGLRALVSTPPVADHLFVTRANLPSAQVDQLRNALLHLQDSAEGRDILEHLHKGMTALIPVKDSDYDSLRKLMKVPRTSP